MTFPGRRISLGRSNGGRERESLLMNGEPSVPSKHHNNKNHPRDPPSYHSGSSYSSGGSDPFEMATKSKSLSASAAAKEEIAAGVMEFIPAFDEPTTYTHNNNVHHDTTSASWSAVDTSWDALMNEGSTAFPQAADGNASRSEVGGRNSSASRFRRKAQSTVGKARVATATATTTNSHHQADAQSTVSAARSKGPRIARLASLFSGKDSKSKSKATPSSSFANNKQSNNNHRHKKQSPHNTTETTLPSSPSRSSSSGGYIGWPGTQDKQGHTVAIQSSYEESDSGPNHHHHQASAPPPPQQQQQQPYGDYQSEREQREMEDWMNSAVFQDISGVTPDPPSPPGIRPDNSFYNETEQQAATTTSQRPNNDSVHMNQLFQDQGAWDIDDDVPSPSRSSISKNSSAYFDNTGRPMVFPLEGAGAARRKEAAAGVMRGMSSLPPTEETLALNNSLTPPHRTFNAENARGYRGFVDKTHDVPNLMDDVDSDSMASSSQTSSRVPSTANGPSGYSSSNGGSSRQQGVPRIMPRVHEDEVLPRDSESDVFDEISKYSLSIGDSEPFDGLSQSVSKQSSYEIRDLHPYEGVPGPQSVVEESKASLKEIRSTTTSVEQRYRDNEKDRSQTGSKMSQNSSNMKVVLLGGGLTTIQTTTEDFSNRITSSDFDDGLTNSDIDEYGNTKLPNFQEMAAAGRGVSDSASAIDISISVGPSMNRRDESGLSFTAFDEKDQGNRAINISGSYKDDESAFFSDFYSGDEVECEGDLSEYYVQPALVKKLVRKYRKMCRITASQCRTYDELDKVEDEKKAFALFEMRSRIMEKDIERGLERRGGTTTVDDIVTTAFHQRAMRIRDAVIVSKAWRDGATPMDVINTAHLTQRAERSYFIKRTIRLTNYRLPNAGLQVQWEQVNWVDDMDFMQYYCPSLGARNLRGTEMFTIGDCQSILLKLTNESCIELREDLNDATARQIEAEEAMKEEGDYGDGMMTEAEMTYLSSMEEVKTISKQLVVAEKAFALVRDRIRNLVAKYESLLVRIDNEDMATSSVVTADSSCFSDEYGSRVSTDYDQEERAWCRRQQRAEISAELAAREALLARQGEARTIQEEKHRELQALQTRLAELQSEPSTTVSDRQRSVVLAKAIAARQQSTRQQGPAGSQPNNGAVKTNQQTKVDDVKQRFRDRMAARLQQKKPQSATTGTRAEDTDFEQQAPPTTHNNHQRYYTMNEQQPPKRAASAKTPADFERQKFIRSAGEEMFQHLDFYERSLKAVELQREGSR